MKKSGQLKTGPQKMIAATKAAAQPPVVTSLADLGVTEHQSSESAECDSEVAKKK
jgi:hypothetical protein